MLSSSYADAVFNDAVLTRLKQMEFGAADVADTQVSQLAITFAPKPD